MLWNNAVKSHLKPISPTVFFNKRWWLSTLLVLVAMGVMARLGVWQLNRLAQRQARNAQTVHQLSLPPLSLNNGDPLPVDLTTLKLRQATASGTFDFSRQVALTQQNWLGSPGIHLITPLIVEGSNQAVLVDRGWIPYDESAPDKWAQFNELSQLPVTGFIKLSQEIPQTQTGITQSPNNMPNAPQTEWYRVDIAAIQAQLPYQLLPVYIEQLPAGSSNNPPFSATPEFDLSEGPHMGYAIQWFVFALILGLGYINYVRKHINKLGELQS